MLWCLPRREGTKNETNLEALSCRRSSSFCLDITTLLVYFLEFGTTLAAGTISNIIPPEEMKRNDFLTSLMLLLIVLED